MGRLKIYHTEEEKKEAQRRWAKEYYWRNKKQIDEKAKKRYKSKK